MDNLDEKSMDINYSCIYGDTYELMKNAGKAIAHFIETTFSKGKAVAVVCGTGNNAGDGICCAELLRENYKVSVALIKGIAGLKTQEARRAINDYQGIYYGISSLENVISQSDIIIDAILGIGIKGEPREPYNEVISTINRSGKTIVSVDVPSGFPSGLAIKPGFTVTFTDVKTGMEKSNSGKIIVADIGVPDAVKTSTGPGDLVYIPPHNPMAHKGINGVAGIFAGNTFPGAAIMASMAAYSTGPDLVKVFSSKLNRDMIVSRNPGLMFYDADTIRKEDMDGITSMLIGPGMGRNDPSRRLINYVLDNFTGQVVVDADALRLLSPDRIARRNAIITPHSAEFRAFTGLDPTAENAIKIAGKYGITVLLKGVTDIITDGKNTKYSTGGNGRMAMGGTGDVLAGIAAGLLSRGMPPFRAAVASSYVNKRSGEMSYNKYGYYYSITDVIKNIKYVLNNKI
ncbi:MAG: NAD(P)H-hydrate dehydratase [Ferroplasma sp.]|uniref:NAD(P)H-hydrate dehydratase n=1 Tax=Ferroplasma sp. TaxID=2591003 RepID=UPI002815F378|nr:NAD(P)H-hydrate dehydratase [Ferroplasma sp.]WMT51643.1 MAG: NAD(P)H-hydrate dehydratase [Ferroplasma sp.]